MLLAVAARILAGALAVRVGGQVWRVHQVSLAFSQDTLVDLVVLLSL